MALFDEFDPVSEAQWKQKIQVDLNGADYNETLISTTPGGIHIKPFYHRESATGSDLPSRGTATGKWYPSQKIYGGNPQAANAKIKDALSRGAQGVIITIPDSQVDLGKLLADLPEHGIQLHPEFMDGDCIAQVRSTPPKILRPPGSDS